MLLCRGLIEIHPEIRDILCGKAHHLDAVRQRYPALIGRLMGRIPVWQEPDLVKAEIFIGEFAEEQMPDMDRVKCASHDTDLHCFIVNSILPSEREHNLFPVILSLAVEDDLFTDHLDDL